MEFGGNDAADYASGHLQMLVDDGVNWTSMYQCPTTGVMWLRDYPHSDQHGGGPTRLTRISCDEPRQVWSLLCRLVRWVCDEPIPGLVEAQLVDADGDPRCYIDKVPIFTDRPITRFSNLPIYGGIRCRLVALPDGSGRVEIELLDVDPSDRPTRVTVNMTELTPWQATRRPSAIAPHQRGPRQ